MARTLLGAVLGGVILVVWGMLAWMVFPIHNDTMKNLPDEQAVVSALQGVPEQGVYIFPGMPKSGSDQAVMDTYMAAYARGPMGFVVYNPEGGDPMMVREMIAGLLISILTALVAIWFFQRSTAFTGTLLQRLSFFGMLGIFLALAAYFTQWNWMGYPLGYTTAMALDTIIAWLLAGLGISLVVKPPKKAVIDPAVTAGATS